MLLYTSVTSCCSSMDVGHIRAVTSSHCRQMIKDDMNSYNKKNRSRMKPELSTNACSVNMVSFFCKAGHSGCHFTVCSAYEPARYLARAGLRATLLCHRILPSFPRNTIFITTTKAVSTTVAPGFAMFPWHPKGKVQRIYAASSHPCFCVMLFFFLFKLETAWCFGR